MAEGGVMVSGTEVTTFCLGTVRPEEDEVDGCRIGCGAPAELFGVVMLGADGEWTRI